ncbi:MAG: YwbE family protein [Thaumarchaeota archaeon]|nr:YwbE family protein [Nitrososphaerota archaeon]
MGTLPKKSQIVAGSTVSIVTKEDQKNGHLTDGIVDEILTNSESHPHGIKVRLKGGKVGRVRIIQ